MGGSSHNHELFGVARGVPLIPDMMRSRNPAEPMRLEHLLDALPRTEAVRPLAARLLGSSRPDEDRRWTASGALGTTGGRIVDIDAFREEAAVWVAEERGRLERRAGAVAEAAEALAAGDARRVVEALLAESGALEADGLSAEARAWADAAFRVAVESGLPRAAEARRKAARCARAQGDLDGAVAAYEDAWARARDAERWDDAVVAATGRGNVSVDRGRWADAEAWYRKAMELLSESGAAFEDGVARALRWRLCQNLGITHRERGDLDGSDAWYRRAEEDSRGLDDPAAVIELENGRGQLALARGDLQAAEARFRHALEAISSTRPDEGRVTVRANLAEALLLRGRSLEAGVAAREAEAEAIRGRYLSRLVEVYRVLARIMAARGEGEAFVLVERALELVRDTDLPIWEEARTLRVYADLREAGGEGDLAREARARAAQIMQDLNQGSPGSGGNEAHRREGGAS